MKQTFKQRFSKIAIWFCLLFLLMFVLRVVYGYLSPGTSYSNDHSESFFSSVADLRKNYASERFMKNGGQQQPDFASSQKYEKTATIKSKTSRFETDLHAIKSITKDFSGVVQYEQNKGNKGSREIHFLIGVAPEKFDSFYLKAQDIGTIKSTEITKIDKTNDFRKLKARKASLEKTLASLNELKSKNGAIADYVSLHDKILEIETQLQELGVELGNFDAVNEFCTVKFSLYEGETAGKISFLRRIKIAFEWTVKYYGVVVVSFALMVTAAFILLLIIDRLKIIKAVTTKLDE